MTEPTTPPAPEGEPAQPHAARPHFVQCPKHGRIYDASKDAGCTQCIAEGTTADAPAEGGTPVPKGKQGLPPSVLLGLLLVLLAIIVVPQFLSQGDEAGTAPAAAGGAPAARAPRLGAGGDDDISRGRPRSGRFDPAVYEQPLRALETALYEAPESDPYAAAGRADGAARLLIAQVLARNTHAVVAQDFMRALEATMSRLDASGEGGYVAPDFYGARGNWERIRTEYFQNAPWYHAPMAPPEVGVGAGGAAEGAHEDPAAFHQAGAFAADLERIIAAYRTTLLSFPDPGTRMTAGESRRVENDYGTFVRRWNDELDQANRQGPRGWYRVGRESAGRLQRASDQLTTALEELRDAAPQGRIPYRGARSTSLQRAENAIQNARRALNAPPPAAPATNP